MGHRHMEVDDDVWFLLLWSQFGFGRRGFSLFGRPVGVEHPSGWFRFRGLFFFRVFLVAFLFGPFGFFLVGVVVGVCSVRMVVMLVCVPLVGVMVVVGVGFGGLEDVVGLFFLVFGWVFVLFLGVFGVVLVVDGCDGDAWVLGGAGRAWVGDGGMGALAGVGLTVATGRGDGLARLQRGEVVSVRGSGAGGRGGSAAGRLLAVGWLRMELHGFGVFLAVAWVSAGGFGQVLGFPRNCEGKEDGCADGIVSWGVFWVCSESDDVGCVLTWLAGSRVVSISVVWVGGLRRNGSRGGWL